MSILSTPVRVIAGAVFAASVLAGCATDQGNMVRQNETQRAQTVQFGVVTNVRPVTIQGNSTAVGTTTGAVVGGAVAGGMAGNAIQGNASARPGAEITVRLDNGQTIAVIQEGSPDAFRSGDRVRVTSVGQTTRVSR